jgi:hypothetical protein
MNVARTRGITPNLPTAGCHCVPVKNSIIFTSGRAKNRRAVSVNTTTIPTVVRIEIAPHANKKPWIMVSPMRGRLARVSAVTGVTLAAVEL